MRAVPCRRRLVASLATACLALVAGAPRVANAQDFPAPERRKVEDMLRGVQAEIVSGYYDSTYHGVNLAAAYDSALTRLRDAQALDKALVAVAWLTLDLHDSHTFFLPPRQTVGVEYGWEMAMIGDSCYVIHVKAGSDAEKQDVRAGDRVISVNGFVPTRINLWQVNYLYRLLLPQPALHAVVQSPGGPPRELTLAAKVQRRPVLLDMTASDGGRDINQILREEDKTADENRSEYVEYGDSVLIWRMPVFAVMNDEVGKIFDRAKHRRALVIDLRNNGGGAEQCLLEILKHLSRDSVVIGTLRQRHKQTALVAKGTGGNAFAGQLYVLVDSRSASASEVFAREVQLNHRGRVLGDRTAGAVMRSRMHMRQLGTQNATIYGVSVTDADLVMSDGGRLEQVGVTPDEMILPTAADLAAGRDVVLARALTLAGAPTDAAKAGRLFADRNR
jgi:C-terminal processing protease CtpA/Prc